MRCSRAVEGRGLDLFFLSGSRLCCRHFLAHYLKANFHPHCSVPHAQSGLNLDLGSVWFAAGSLETGASLFTSAVGRVVGGCVNRMCRATTKSMIVMHGTFARIETSFRMKDLCGTRPTAM